jgi:hypothetical protein
LTITGNLTQTNDARVDLELGGTAAGSFDVVAVSNTATLAGTVKVSTVGGFAPAAGNRFDVITAAARSGNFRAVDNQVGTQLRAEYGTGLAFIVDPTNIDRWISTDGDWSVPGNWDLGHVPGAGETALLDQPGTLTVTIPAGTFTPDRVASNENITITGGTLSLASANPSQINGTLAINGGGSLQGVSPVVVVGTLALGGGTVATSGGVVVVGTTSSSGATQLSGPLATTLLSVTGGAFNIGAGSLLAINGGGASTVATSASLANSGTLRLFGGGSLTVAPGATFTNATGASLEVLAGSATINGFATNPGGITLGTNAALTTSVGLASSGPVTLGTGSTLATGGASSNSGTMTLGSGSTFATGGNSFTNTGTVSGFGTFNLGGTGTFFNNGMFVPGTSPGTTTITGNYTQGPTGVLAIELAGLTPGTLYDVVNVSGIATLDGTMNVTTLGGFVPVFGDRFDVMNYGGLVGNFATINAGVLQAQPSAATYTLTVLGIPRDNTADELKRLTDELLRVAALEAVEEPRFKGGRQICQ